MTDYFDRGFCVRTPSWHRKEILLDDYPGREEGMRLAGHDFTVKELPIALVGNPRMDNVPANPGPAPYLVNGNGSEVFGVRHAKGWKGLVNSETGDLLQVVKSSYEVIQNSTGWDIVDLLVGEGAKYETGITLKGGAICLVTFLLDEPVRISGDDSIVLPYGVSRWTHDGSGSLTCRSTSVRAVCSNTDDAGAMEARRLGTEFRFRHTKNVKAKIEDAKLAIRGIRADFAEFVRLSEELATIKVTKEQRELFVTQLLPVPPEALISERVLKNVEDARTSVRNLFEGRTIPEDHKLTAYGLRLAGIEYLDHLRGYRNADTHVGRQLLRTEPAKAKLSALIREVVKA
jgi:phage/plasmid-like protein (TIGR03299 family)